MRVTDLKTLVATSCLVTALLSWFLRRQPIAAPSSLLESAYSDLRTMELRIVKAPHSPVRVRRGENSGFDRPQSLLEVEAAIARGLRKDPEDGRLLAARGQANLLEWSYEAAITDMQQALDSQPRSATVLNGLAAAYFERAESRGRFDDYGAAFELQSRALKFSPGDPIILFNRAITAARLYLYKQSVEDWQAYLSIDASKEWADEARQRLSEVQAIVEVHDQKTKEPLLTPTEFARSVDGANFHTWDRVEPRIEEYLSTAITDWLPVAFPVRTKGPASSDARSALTTLSLILRTNHGDTWLCNLLASATTDGFAEGILALSEAARADGTSDDYLLGRKQAVHAAKAFSKSFNSAGKVRAEFEEIYALHLSDAASECLKKASALSRHLDGFSYPWIESQLNLEESVCVARESDIDRSADLETAAYDKATAAHYSALSLRALGFLADVADSKGKKRQSWSLCRTGMQQYWSSSLYPMPGYNLYTFMERMAKEEHQWHLELSIGQQALAILPDSGDPLLTSVEYSNLARAAIMAGTPRLAQDELAAAGRLLDSAPQTPVTQNYRLDLQIDLAQIEERTIGPEVAVARLATLRQQVARILNEDFSANYYRVVGELQDAGGYTQAAEEAFEAAGEIAERQRDSLKSESDRLTWMREMASLYRDLVQEKLRAQDAISALAVWELYRSAALRPSRRETFPSEENNAGTYQLANAIAEERDLVGRSLPTLNRRTVLVYALVPRGLSIWIYNDQGVTARWVDKDPDYIRMLARRLGELCSTPSSSVSAIQSTAQKLYKLLIVPVAEQLRSDEALVIEADDDLMTMPFQVLLDEGGHYFAEEHPISYSLGLGYLDRLRAEDEVFTASASALVVASAAGGEDVGLRRLSDAVAEAQNVTRYFSNAHMLEEDTASLANVRSELPHVAVFHFAGHARIESGQLGLLLASNHSHTKPTVLDAHVLDGLPLPNLRLAVLSACSTENGPEGTTLEPESLARSFLRAGVPHVIASRWNVDSGSSAALVRIFYGALLSGQSVAQSLATARHRLRTTEPHPYYWAAFDAFGQP
jgi:CHAT domain-containing protein